MINIPGHEYIAYIGTDGVMRTERADTPPLIYPRLSTLQRITRKLTPKRWRKPLRPINDPLARHQRLMEATLKAVETLTKSA